MFYRMSFDPTIRRQAFISPIRFGNLEANESELIRHNGPISTTDTIRGEIAQIGIVNDINFGSHDILICRDRATEILKADAASELQTIPIDIAGESTRFYIVHLLSIIDCIDVAASQYMLWTQSSFRPELAGEYQMMMKMVVDPARVGEHKIFRAKGWETPVVVHDSIKANLETAGCRGASFQLLDK